MIIKQAMDFVSRYDAEVGSMIYKEFERQCRNIELIASENIVSEAVMAAMGSVLTNKYAEGYPAKRYYGGCECVDEVENLAIDRVCKLFGAKYANVQPHSGAQANMAVYQALVKPGDTVLGMSLDNGGHLTHGSPVNQSGLLYNIVSYGVDENGFIDYNEVEKIGATGDEATGVQIVLKALEAPIRQIAENAGIEGSIIVYKLKELEPGFGYNAATNEFVDMFQSGIVDPTKVTRSALQNAASISASFLTAEAAVVEIEKPQAPQSPADMGGMGMM